MTALLRGLSRRPLLTLGVWGAAWSVAVYCHFWLGDSHPVDLGDFVYGGHVLLGGSSNLHDTPLHLYAQEPLLQVGPPVLLFFGLLFPLPEHGLMVATAALIFACAMIAMASIKATVEALAGDRRQTRQRFLLGGMLVMPAWSTFLVYWHLEDAIAIMAIAVAFWVISNGRPSWAAGLALGFGIACKPWALVVAPIILGLPSFRQQARAAASAAGLVLACWAPFVIADSETVTALGGLDSWLAPGSVLHALGARGLVAPHGAHSLMYVVALLLGGIAVYRKRWFAVPLVALAGRILLEPKAFLYYGCGPLVAAWLLDMRSERRRAAWLPLWTTVTLVAEFLIPMATSQVTASFVRLGWVVIVLFGVLLPPPSLRSKRPESPNDLHAQTLGVPLGVLREA